VSYLELAKKAGEDAAKEEFGLNKTDKPPPQWAHGRKVTIPSMTQKTMKHDCQKCGNTKCTCQK
jgi:hypothetical protein